MRLILCGLFVITMAHAADFSKADGLFAQRENNPFAIHAAQALYEGVLYHSGDRVEQTHAMNQLGRLAYYEGELMTSMDDSTRRMAIFAKSQAYAEYAGSAYWKALSLALWSQSAGTAAAWWYMDDFKKVFKQALVQDVTTDNGGIFRLLGVLYAKSKDLQSYDLYDPDLALAYANKAMELGPQRLEAYLIRADAFKELGKIEAAEELLKNTIENFKSVPEFEPENKMIMERIKKAF